MATDEIATAAKVPGDRRHYLPHELEAGLQALVMCGGSSHKACQLTGIPKSTFATWRHQHRDRIEEIRRERGPELEQLAINGLRSFVVAAEEVKELALEATRKDLERGTCRDPGRALSYISVAQGISVQRSLELDGRPQGVKPGEASVPELMAQLHKLFDQPAPVDATVVEPEQLPESST
ncbi:MAG TPA: hypothetical protein VE645_19030 [Pseudonocardiaceae bacterium]|jgi:transposase-like protein|nr:hypothetical protein [Pseudonocardiaceae bacterium]